MKSTKTLLLALVCTLTVGAPLRAENIYVIDAGVSGHPEVQNAETYLTNLGHSITTGNTLGSYAGYDQVWDLRYDVNFVVADVSAMGAYLQSGGRMYITGEHPGFDTDRNQTLVTFIAAIGGGTMVLPSQFDSGVPQPITGAGAIVNSPNAYGSVQYAAASLVTGLTQGFLVTEDPANLGHGSLIGWDFGDISGAPNARLLVGMDIEIFNPGNVGQDWTENMVTYLGRPVPEPAGIAMGGLGLVSLVAIRAFRRKR